MYGLDAHIIKVLMFGFSSFSRISKKT